MRTKTTQLKRQKNSKKQRDHSIRFDQQRNNHGKRTDQTNQEHSKVTVLHGK